MQQLNSIIILHRGLMMPQCQNLCACAGKKYVIRLAAVQYLYSK